VRIVAQSLAPEDALGLAKGIAVVTALELVLEQFVMTPAVQNNKKIVRTNQIVRAFIFFTYLRLQT